MPILKNILISSSFAIAFISSLACYADVSVNGYYKKNGTYVKPHMRSNPDSSFRNNWSTIGNINPYTGRKGTKIVPNYNRSLTRSSTLSSNSYSSQLSNINSDDINSTVNYNSLVQPYDFTTKLNKPTELRDYETVQLESTLKLRIDNIDWYHLSQSENDIAYVRKGVRGYFNNYPTISVMFKGATQSNEKPAWLGTKFVKFIVDCKNDKIALVADAVVASNGKVLGSIDYPTDQNVKWNSISDSFNSKLFKSTSEACS